MLHVMGQNMHGSRYYPLDELSVATMVSAYVATVNQCSNQICQHWHEPNAPICTNLSVKMIWAMICCCAQHAPDT